LRCPGGEDPPPEASEAPAREADKHMSREADRQELPAPMRRDVRLLGDLLGEVIRESGGQDLLDDVGGRPAEHWLSGACP
jgi:phosphoenolpyruvate carboxylase